MGIDLGNVENTIHRLEREIENPIAQSPFYSLEKRLIDARVYYELKNYPKAAVMYLDAVANARFRGHPDRNGVMFRLGFSLFKLKNYLAAREYFNKLIATGGGSYYDKGLRYLVEIGLETRSDTGLATTVARVGRIPNRSAETQYAWAKGLYRLGRTQEALGALGQVPQSSRLFLPAQYYAGVIWTERGKLKSALAAFKSVAAGKTTSKNGKRIRELAHLGLGRLFLELKDYTRAIDAYQEIDRHSDHFHTALYEMTWAHINAKQFGKALNALEILLLTVKDEHLATQANILRGRLNILLDQTDLAVETYQEIVGRFSPLRDELNTFSKRRDNLAAYFKWLLRRHSDAFQLGAVLSERASRWIESDEQLKEVVEIFDEMSHQRTDVREAEGLLKELDQALSAGNRVEIFPKLKGAWTRIIVSENHLLKLSQQVLNATGMLARSQMSQTERKQLDLMLVKRRRLEKRFKKAPKTVAEFNARTRTVQKRYIDLKRDSFLLENSLKQVRDELAAMEKWLNEARYGVKNRKIDAKQEKQLTSLLTVEKRRLKKLHDDLLRLKGLIGRQNASVGAGDFVSEDETRLRRRLLAAHREEGELLNAVLLRLAGSDRAQAQQLQGMRGRIVGDFKRLGTLLKKIDRAVDRKVGDYKRQVAAERRLIGMYRRQVASFDHDSDRVAKEIGVPLFKMAHGRITDVVLEADLGLVDVAWKRKKAESGKIVALQKEQGEQLKHLEATMKAILKD